MTGCIGLHTAPQLNRSNQDVSAILPHNVFGIAIKPGPGSFKNHRVNGCLLQDAECWGYQRRKLTMPSYDNLVAVTLYDEFDNLVAGTVTANATSPNVELTACPGECPGECTGECPGEEGHHEIHHQFTDIKVGTMISANSLGYEVCVFIDHINTTCLQYVYAVRTTFNETRCEDADCIGYFDGSSECEVAKHDCVSSGCTASAHHTNVITLLFESGWFSENRSTKVTIF